MRGHQLLPVGCVCRRPVPESGPPRAGGREEAAAHGVFPEFDIERVNDAH